MLVLTLKLGESLVIGDGVIVTAVDIRGYTARIGIEAPKSIAVHRSEVAERIAAERSAGLPPPEKIPALRSNGDGTYGDAPVLTRKQRNAIKQYTRDRNQGRGPR